VVRDEVACFQVGDLDHPLRVVCPSGPETAVFGR
jgi:hypothetical protein